MSEDEKAIRAGIKDEKGILPYEILMENGLAKRIEPWAARDPRGVFDYYKELKTSGLCDQGFRDVGDKMMRDGKAIRALTRDPRYVCHWFLADAAKQGEPDANFEEGLRVVVDTEKMIRRDPSYHRPEIERSLKFAREYFTIAQTSKSPGVADAARKALDEFQSDQISRGYGGAESDQMRAVMLGLMAVSTVETMGKLGEAAEANCNARKAGAMAGGQALPNC